ncbi:hypothetical protein ACVU7I_01710 [Patulibacter sp. S7RM1-6]
MMHDERPAPTLADFPSLEAFGDGLVRAGARGGRRSIGLASFLGAVAALLAFTGAAAVALTAATGSPVPGFARGDDTSVYPRPGTSRVSDLRADDPSGGPPWTIRVGRARDGLVCVGVGQLRGGRFGVLGLDGRFRASAPVGNDACGPAPAPGRPHAAFRTFSGPAAGRPEGATTVVYGTGGADLRVARLTASDGRVRRLRLDAAGSFVAALEGWPEGVDARLDLRWKDGQSRRVSLGVEDTLPDPAGRFGWAVEPVFRTKLPSGRSTVGCLGVRPAREMRWGTAVCVGAPGTAVLRRVRGNGSARGILVLREVGDHVVVRASGREIRTLATRTAGPVRVAPRRKGVRRARRTQNPAGGPRARIAVLPGDVHAADITVTSRRDGRTVRTVPTEGERR